MTDRGRRFMPRRGGAAVLHSLVLAISLILLTGATMGIPTDPQADLLHAVVERDLAAVVSALNNGAKPNAVDAFRRTPLHTAAHASTEEIIELLLVRGGDPNALDNDGRTPLHLSNSMSAEILLRHKADARVLDKQGNSALHTAAEQDGAAMCRLIVQAGVSANVRNRAGLTPLHFAALQGQRRAAEYLLNQGAEINAKTMARYAYKWTYVAWDVKGMEQLIDVGQTATSIARTQHKKNRFVTSRYGELNGDGILVPAEVDVDTAWSFIGPSLPTLETSFSNTIGFFENMISITALVDYKGGHFHHWGAERDRCTAGNCRAVNDPTSSLKDQAYGLASSTASLRNSQDGFIVSGNYIRFREASVAVRLPKSFMRNTGTKDATLVLSGRNIRTLSTKYPGLDPEAGGQAQETNWAPPPLRYWIAKFNFSF